MGFNSGFKGLNPHKQCFSLEDSRRYDGQEICQFLWIAVVHCPSKQSAPGQ